MPLHSRIGILCIALLTAGASADDAQPNIALFGVPLRISEAEFNRLTEAANIHEISTLFEHRGQYPDAVVPIKHATIKGTIKPVPGSAKTTVSVFDARVYQVVVALEDVSTTGWQRIRAKLAEKFGESKVVEQHELDQPSTSYEKATPHLSITANYQVAGDDRCVRITYSDPNLMRKIEEKIRQRNEEGKRRRSERLRRPGRNDQVDLDSNL